MLVSLSFTKELVSWGADISLTILYIRVAFVWKRLVSRVFHFKLFNISVDLTSYEEPVMTLTLLGKPGSLTLMQFYITMPLSDIRV